MANPFTTARLSLWDAIDNWGPLNLGGLSVFNRKRRRDGDARLLPAAAGISLAQVSSIDIRPGNTSINWDVNTEQKVDYVCNVLIVALKLPKLEQLVFDTWNGIYQAAAPMSMIGYVRAATGYNPLNLQVTWAPATEVVNGATLKAESAVIAVGLRFQSDPFGRP
jgi:hypothetical protein